MPFPGVFFCTSVHDNCLLHEVLKMHLQAQHFRLSLANSCCLSFLGLCVLMAGVASDCCSCKPNKWKLSSSQCHVGLTHGYELVPGQHCLWLPSTMRISCIRSAVLPGYDGPCHKPDCIRESSCHGFLSGKSVAWRHFGAHGQAACLSGVIPDAAY